MKLEIFIASVILLVMITLTIRRNEEWRSPIKLWAATVRESPMKIRPRFNLARAYQEAGRDDEALQEYRNALILSNQPMTTQSDRTLVHQMAAMNAGQLLIKRNQLDDAEQLMVSAWNEDPGFPGIAANLSVIYMIRGQKDMARKLIEFGIENLPQYPWFAYGGNLYLLRGQLHEGDGDCALANQDYEMAAQMDADIALVRCAAHKETVQP